MANRNIFITGSTGKIGQFLVNELRKEEGSIFLLDNSCLAKKGSGNIEYVQGDLLDPASYDSSLRGMDVVVHMAALTHTNKVRKYYDINARGTLNLLESCKRHGVKKFIFISTRAISEDGGDYSRSKAMAEKYVQDSALEWVILRLAEVYGMSEGKGVDMLLSGAERFPFIPVVGSGDYTICPVHVKDVVFSIRQAISKSDITGRIYTIAGPMSYTYNELIDVILKIKHLTKVRIHLPIALLRMALKMSALFFGDRFMVMDQLPRLISGKSDDISLAKEYLAFEPNRIENMIGDHG